MVKYAACWPLCILLTLSFMLTASAKAAAFKPLSDGDMAEMTKVVVTMTGDCVLGGEEKSRKKETSFDSLIAQKGMAWPFSAFSQQFAQDDITLVNLEGVLKDTATGRLADKTHTFRGVTAYTEILRLGSVEHVNIANNHYIDYGKAGRTSTLKALKQAGIAISGYKELHAVEIGGKKIGFGGIRETVYRQERKTMAEDIQALAEMDCDVIIYSCHFGDEYGKTHNTLQTKMTREAIDLGADFVVGHHPHVVQGIEYYNGGVILYSLGNFVFGGNLELKEFDSYAVEAAFLWEGEKYRGVQLELIPVLTSGTIPENDFRPVPALGEDKARIYKKIQKDSKLKITDCLFFPGKAD